MTQPKYLSDLPLTLFLLVNPLIPRLNFLSFTGLYGGGGGALIAVLMISSYLTGPSCGVCGVVAAL